MAVTETAPPAGQIAPRGGGKPGSGGWIKQHKAIVGAGALGVGALVLSHKGGGGSGAGSATTASTTAADAAAEQAAIDQAVGDQSGVIAGSAGGDTSSGSDGGTAAQVPTTDPTNPSTPSVTGAGGSAPVGPINVTVNNPASQLPKKATTTPKKAKPKAPVKKAAAKPAAKSKPKPKPAPKKPAPKTKPKTHTKGSVMKYGRAFDGAQSVHVGRGQQSSDGVLHEPVTVNYGGFSETHMSHNRGQAWTDNVPGYSPPSRGVPLVRLGTA